MSPFTTKAVEPSADPSAAQTAATTEAALQEALDAARNLVSSLKSENTRLRHVNLESQRIITRLKSSRTARTRSDYKHARLSVLLHELERLQRGTQPQALQNFLPDATITRLARAIHEEQKGAPTRDMRAANLQRCLEILLGATLQCGNQPAVHIGMLNPESGDRLAFELRWDDEHVEYTRQDAQFSTELPELAREEAMHFEIAQGPNFLKELINCLYPPTTNPPPHSPKLDDEHQPEV
ncbi:hypothetical protein FGB62_92g023 [Gracilaria domingensis]|nr:hypothetical protein FGB62_92g023 [Gracilaria domingensis]